MHSDIPTRAQLAALFEQRDPCSVTIYLPTGRSTLAARTARTELANIRRDIDERLRTRDASDEDREAIVEAIDSIVDDEPFWSAQSNTLAIFVSPASEQTFRIPNDLSASVHVSDRFHTKPLLRAVTFPNAAFVLALSKGESRLLEIFNEGEPVEVDVPDMPRDAWVPPANHFHMARERPYVRQIDHALRPVLNGSDLPLIVAATESIDALFRTVNTSPNLVERRVPGNPEELSDADLADAARTILDEIYAAELTELALTFDRRSSQGRTAFDLSDIARLATMGAVDTVLVDIDADVDGTIDEKSGAVEFSDADGDEAESYGIIDEITRRVIANGGRVLAVRAADIPSGGQAAALLRYVP